MRKRFSNIFIIAFLFSSIFCNAQWSTSPSSHNIIASGLNLNIMGDNEGGCYVLFEYGSMISPQIGIIKLNKYGEKAWPEQVNIKGTRSTQFLSGVISDDFGNIIVAYADENTSGPPLLKLQKVDKEGHFLWKDTGLWIDSSNATRQTLQAIVSDGEGGCVVTWVDSLFFMRINRIAHNGETLWDERGKYVMYYPISNLSKLVKTTRNRYIFNLQYLWKWYDDQGNLLLTDSSYYPGNILPAEDGGIVFETFEGNWPENYNMYLRKSDSLGQPAWDDYPVHIADSLNVNAEPGTIISNGYLVSYWFGYKNGIENVPQFQFVKMDGNKILQEEGIALCNENVGMSFVEPIVSLNGKTIFVYEYDTGRSDFICGQLYDALGNKCWGESDITISNHPIVEQFIPDEKGGFIYSGVIDEFLIFVDQVSLNGILGEVIVTGFEKNTSETPVGIELFQNYPNPFNSTTRIEYNITSGGNVKLILYNILGEKLYTLVNRFQYPGTYSYYFSAGNLSSGVYLYRIYENNKYITKKMVILN